MKNTSDVAGDSHGVYDNAAGTPGGEAEPGAGSRHETQTSESSVRTPQSGIFALGTASVSYLEFDLHPDAEPETVVRLVADLRNPPGTTGGVNLVIGFRP